MHENLTAYDRKIEKALNSKKEMSDRALVAYFLVKRLAVFTFTSLLMYFQGNGMKEEVCIDSCDHGNIGQYPWANKMCMIAGNEFDNEPACCSLSGFTVPILVKHLENISIA